MSDIQFPIIKTREDLSSLIDYLSTHGFGYISEYELHNRKINNIINNANKMNIDYDNRFKSKLIGFNDYDEAEKEANIFFSKYTINDKIFEFLRRFSIHSDESARVPYNSPSNSDVIEWYEFKSKHKLKDEYPTGSLVSYYNLDKNYLKIYYNSDKYYEFNELYKYIFNEKPENELEYRTETGVWINMGKIEFKSFSKGGANIKGNIQIFKEYYMKKLTNESYNNIIKYNNQVTLIKSKERD